MPSFSSLSLSIPFLLLVFCLIGLQAADDLADKSGGDVCAGFSDPGGCTINCFRADPVCGADGVTYWCGCPDAACHGARVVKRGACDAAYHICSIDEIASQFVSDLDDQIPSLCSVEEIGSQFVSDLDDQIPSLCSVEEMGSQFVSGLDDQNPKSSKIASFDQNSYSSLDEIYDKPSSQSFCLDGSSSPSQTCCLRETKEEYNSFSLAQETETQTDPLVNVGRYNDQSFWDNLYKDDVFGLNSDFRLDNNNNLQENTTPTNNTITRSTLKNFLMMKRSNCSTLIIQFTA